MGLIKQRIVLIIIGIGILAVATNDDISRNQVELVLYNGNIITVDDDMPGAESVAISGERVVYVGSSDTALSLASKDTELIDLKGKTLIPGFNDDHTHTLGAGAFYLQPMLWGLSCEEVAEVVRKDPTARTRISPCSTRPRPTTPYSSSNTRATPPGQTRSCLKS
jgi:hypothetical protein